MKYSGSIVSISGGLTGAVYSAVGNGSNCFMCFTRPPQNRNKRPMSQLKVEEGLKLLEYYNLPSPVVHAPYIANLASPDPYIVEASLEILTSEVERALTLRSKYLVIHPGCYTYGDSENGIKKIAEGIDSVIDEFYLETVEFYILLESMAGKGSELGKNFQELREIRDRCRNKDRVAFCLDTCHLHDYGYPLDNLDFMRKAMDKILGYDNIKVCHVAGSKNYIGARKDKHAALEGVDNKLSAEVIKAFVNLPELDNTWFILETPDSFWYSKELEFLRR